MPCTTGPNGHASQSSEFTISHLVFLFPFTNKMLILQGIANTMAYLQGEGRLLRGEHNLLGEAFLVMASSAG